MNDILGHRRDNSGEGNGSDSDVPEQSTLAYQERVRQARLARLREAAEDSPEEQHNTNVLNQGGNFNQNEQDIEIDDLTQNFSSHVIANHVAMSSSNSSNEDNEEYQPDPNDTGLQSHSSDSNDYDSNTSQEDNGGPSQ